MAHLQIAAKNVKISRHFITIFNEIKVIVTTCANFLNLRNIQEETRTVLTGSSSTS